MIQWSRKKRLTLKDCETDTTDQLEDNVQRKLVTFTCIDTISRLNVRDFVSCCTACRHAQYEHNLIGIKTLLEEWDRFKGEVRMKKALQEPEAPKTPTPKKGDVKKKKVDWLNYKLCSLLLE